MWSDDLLQKWPRGKLFILSAPAGAGKTTLLQMVLDTFSCVKTSPSYTTRPRRNNEVDGREYHFVSRETFLQKQTLGDFLETIELHGNFYGTSKHDIAALLDSGKHVLLVIDTRGAFNLKETFDPVLVFLKTHSLEILRERLEKRGSENEKLLESRLEWAKKELEEERHFQYSVVNDSLEKAFSVIASILVAETNKVQKGENGKDAKKV